MPSVQIQVIFVPESLNPEDVAINTWAFTGTDSAGALVTEARTRLDEFYSSTPTGGTGSIIDWGVDTLSYASTYYKAYDIADPEPRTPIDQDLLGLSTPTLINGIALPSEVALCLSFQAAMASGQPPARRRGRVYLGPLGFGTVAPTANQPARPEPDFMTDVELAASRLAGHNDAACSWGVYSRVDGVVRPVVGGWVDNAFDIQRRRGVDWTVRNEWLPV